MSGIDLELASIDADDEADGIIGSCLTPSAPTSFFLYAGAGSGKTRSLKIALEGFRDRYGNEFRRHGKRLAVITYTNAAADEIAERVGMDPLFPISTIHSFCWAQIGTFHNDIRTWLREYLPTELAELREKHSRGRGGKAAIDRERAMEGIQRRLERLQRPIRFTYNPNGDNFGADALSHSEVLKISASFIESKPSMQAALVNRFPFLLIDESQDTSSGLIDALFRLSGANEGAFALGLFGDTMQRIYADGRSDLGQNLPSGWARPAKRLNHRSAQRIVQLGNALRSGIDGQRQCARDDSAVGTARLFVASSSTTDKVALERRVRERMAHITSDDAWETDESVKTLTLEHHMAASRRGFLAMYQALAKDSRLSTGLRTGELAGLRFFTDRVVPLVAASKAGDKFAQMAHLRNTSPLLSRSALASCGDLTDPLQPARDAIASLLSLNLEDEATQFIDVLQCVAAHGLFEIPTALMPFADRMDSSEIVENTDDTEEEDSDGDSNESPASLSAWRQFLETPYLQILPYTEYVRDQGPYGTHQGVKGLQFERVFVILDDSDARGFLFSYEKLFGSKPLTAGDRKRMTEGSETGIERTQRLLYVTCTRAKKSLAVMAYAESPKAFAAAAVQKGWFDQSEIEIV